MSDRFQPIRCVVAAGAAFALSACVPVDEPAADAADPVLAALDTGRACFFEREVNGFAYAPDSPSGRERVWLSTGVNERWLLETYAACPDLDFSQQLALDVRGSTSVCTGDTETLIVPDTLGGAADRCLVRVLGRSVED